jgi:peptidoglycan/LPS O-acetylase OafA/YrhL
MRLQRVMTAGRWVPEIDGMRFIAISSVLLLHIFFQMVSHDPGRWTLMNAHRGLYVRMGYLSRGVQLFFVISGYILARPFVTEYANAGKPVSLGAYYKRRLTRLEPPYLLSVLIYSAALLLIRRDDAKVVARGTLESIFYVHNIFHGHFNLNPAAWTLEVEVQFYLIAPLLALLYTVRPNLLRRTFLVVLVVVAAMWQHPRADFVGFYLPDQICFFLLGYLLADLHVGPNASLKHWGWDVVSLISWPALFLAPNREGSVLLCLVLFACFCSALLGPVTRRVFSTRLIALIGGMCYSIYLTHELVLWAGFAVTRRAVHSGILSVDYLIQLMLLLPLIFGFGLVYYILIERPCMDPAWPTKLRNFIVRGKDAEQTGSPATSISPSPRDL